MNPFNTKFEQNLRESVAVMLSQYNRFLNVGYIYAPGQILDNIENAMILLSGLNVDDGVRDLELELFFIERGL